MRALRGDVSGAPSCQARWPSPCPPLAFVVFYWSFGQDDRRGCTCLAPGEKYADDLTDDVFERRNDTNFGPVDDGVGSHAWVSASACAPNSWLT
ncbi:hypothetical protein [Streptomyces sp. A5-4]|uniref:hypothetical protein n=1 Tax=Streptomyces sp. A5-4 TaxID=3384771 RepID=UPI003DAA3E64